MSPYKSDSQRKKFHELLKEGKIPEKVVKDFDEESKGLKLPDRAPSPNKKSQKVRTVDQVGVVRKIKRA